MNAIVVISDNRLTYSITRGNIGNVFQVVPETGEIKVARPLDYEKGPRVSYYMIMKFKPIIERNSRIENFFNFLDHLINL